MKLCFKKYGLGDSSKDKFIFPFHEVIYGTPRLSALNATYLAINY
jgi:hypothetical protein